MTDRKEQRRQWDREFIGGFGEMPSPPRRWIRHPLQSSVFSCVRNCVGRELCNMRHTMWILLILLVVFVAVQIFVRSVRRCVGTELCNMHLHLWLLLLLLAVFVTVEIFVRLLAELLCHQKKHSCLFLVCLVLFIMFFSQTNQVNLPLLYRNNPKPRLLTNEIYETTKHPAVPPPQLPPTRPPTVPSTGTLFHQAYPGNYHFIMDNTEVCKTKTPFVVLMVPVAPKNLAARDAIRETWGKDSLVQEKVVLTLFMLGLSGGADVEQQQKQLKEENLQHHDLIQSNFMDTYLNLTIKTMVIMDWLATRCPTAAYAMKIDSDVFLNIDNLVIMLLKPGIPKLNYLTGMLMWNRPVVRSNSSKWYVSKELYPEPQYPTYTLGMGYVFSNDLPGRFVEASKSIKPFNIEDAYIGMCMKKLGLKPTSPPIPSQFKAYSPKYDRCEYSKIITYILGSSQQLVKHWTDLKRPEPPCLDHKL